MEVHYHLDGYIAHPGETCASCEKGCVCGGPPHRGECHFGWHKLGCKDKVVELGWYGFTMDPWTQRERYSEAIRGGRLYRFLANDPRYRPLDGWVRSYAAEK
jgi:hypothetical protein